MFVEVGGRLYVEGVGKAVSMSRVKYLPLLFPTLHSIHIYSPALRPHIRALFNTPILLIPTPTQTELECLPRTLFAAIMLASFPSPTTLPWTHFLPPGNPTLNARAVCIYLHHVLTTGKCPLLPQPLFARYSPLDPSCQPSLFFGGTQPSSSVRSYALDTKVLLTQTHQQTNLVYIYRAFLAAIMHTSFQHLTEHNWIHYLRPSTPTQNSRAVRTYPHYVLTTIHAPHAKIHQCDTINAKYLLRTTTIFIEEPHCATTYYNLQL